MFNRRTRSALWSAVAILFLALSVSHSAPAQNAKGKRVIVYDVAGVDAALAAGASEIVPQPGLYVFDHQLNLKNTALVAAPPPKGSEPSVIFEVDPLAIDPHIDGAFIRITGNTKIENIKFLGLDSPVVAYIGSLAPPCTNGIGKNHTEIRGNRFITADWVSFQDLYLGNIYGAPGSCVKSTWDIVFENNYVSGAIYGLVVLNMYTDSPDAVVTARIDNNEWADPWCQLLVFGVLGGTGGTTTGSSSGNIFHDALGTGLTVIGGVDSFGTFSANGRASWNSNHDHFIKNGLNGIGVIGGQREGEIPDGFGPNTGNAATVVIESPEFQNNYRDAVFAGSFSLFSLPANAIDDQTLGPGNTVRASLHGARFDTPPGKVFVKNSYLGQGGDPPLPPMDAQPSHGNRVTLNGSATSFVQSNPGVNPVPSWYFAPPAPKP